MKSLVESAFIALCILLIAYGAQAKTVRATELDRAAWTKVGNGVLGDMTIEFRQGDQLPINLKAEGDLVETPQPIPSTITVKRNFWIRSQSSKLQFSLDGQNFKDISDAISGSLEVGADTPTSGGIADAIHINFKSFLK